MSDHEETNQTARPGVRRSIRFAPQIHSHGAESGRVFLVEGDYDPDDLAHAVSFLVDEVEVIFKSIERADGRLCVTLQSDYEWLTELPFLKNAPTAVVIINQKVGESLEAPVLTYLLFVLCGFLDWDARDVQMGEAQLDA